MFVRETLSLVIAFVVSALSEVCDKESPKGKRCPDYGDQDDEIYCCLSTVDPGAYYCCDAETVAKIEREKTARDYLSFMENHFPYILAGLLGVLALIILVTVVLCYLSKNYSHYARTSKQTDGITTTTSGSVGGGGTLVSSLYGSGGGGIGSRYRPVRTSVANGAKPRTCYEAPPPYTWAQQYPTSSSIGNSAAERRRPLRNDPTSTWECYSLENRRNAERQQLYASSAASEQREVIIPPPTTLLDPVPPTLSDA